VLVSRSFYTLHALSLQFSSLMFETFLELLELSNSSCEVQCLRFQACEATLLNLITLSSSLFIENMLYTLHATYIKHDLYADFSLKFKKLLKEFSCDRFTVQDEQNLSLLRFQQFTS